MRYTYEELEAAGFQKHKTSEPYAVALWQKRIRTDHTDRWDAGITLFFINVFEYPAVPEHGMDQSFTAEARLYGHGEAEFSFDLKVQFAEAPNDSPACIEGFFRGAFERLLCKPDPHNND